MARLARGDGHSAALNARQCRDDADAELGTQLHHAAGVGHGANDRARVVQRVAVGWHGLAQAQSLTSRSRVHIAFTLEVAEVAPCRHGSGGFIGDAQIDHAVGRLHRQRPDFVGCHAAQAAAFDHRRAAHADARALGGDDHIAASEHRRVAGKAAAGHDADQGHLPRQRGQAREARAVQAGHHWRVDVARPTATAFGVEHEGQLQPRRKFEHAVAFLMVEVALRAGQHGVVVGHHGNARALRAEGRGVDRARASDEAVGRRVALQIIQAAPAALRGHGECAVLGEAAFVEQGGDVLARRALALGVARGHGIRPRRVVEPAAPRLQRQQRWPRRLVFFRTGHCRRGFRCCVRC